MDLRGQIRAIKVTVGILPLRLNMKQFGLAKEYCKNSKIPNSSILPI